LRSLYASFGFHVVEIDYEVIKKNKNVQLVDLIFNINEGKISKINKIFFIGNNTFTDSKLRSIIKTRQRNYLKLSRSSNYKQYQIDEDERKLINFYKESGFKNINIEIKDEFIKKRNALNVYFYINEGTQYFFGEIDFDFNKLDLNEEIIENIINDEKIILSKILKKNNLYNPDVLENTKNRLVESFYDNGKFFFKIDVLEKKLNNNYDIKIKVSEIEPIYVNNINVYGNTRTKEKVIRREIPFVEGDPFNAYELKIAKTNLQKLGFFKTIEINENKFNNQIDLDIEVEEISTGEFQLGVGIDTFEGATFITGLREKNIFGEGRELNVRINTSANNTIYSFGIVEPYIFNRDVDFIYDISYAYKDRSDSSSYNLNEFNTDIGFKYNLSEKISHSVILEYILKDYEVTSTSASDSIQKLGGNNADFLLANYFNYFDLDSFIRPSKGIYTTYSNIISPATNADNGYIKNLVTFSKYFPYKKINIFSIRAKIGNIFSLQNKELAVDDKFALGGAWLRGFDQFGVGPRESYSSYVGGKNIIATKFDYNRPFFGDKDNPIDFNLFTDIGTVFDNKVDPAKSDESIRASYGFGLKFYSPIGPIGFSWGFPLLKKDDDIERMFTFSVGLMN